MKNQPARKKLTHNGHKAKSKIALRGDHKKDVATVSIIHGLNFLIDKANALGINTAARLLYTAKEDLVFWAVAMNFHETAEEKFINRHLYDNNVWETADMKAYIDNQPHSLT